LEVADILVINKADRPGVRETKRDLVHMLELSHGLEWVPPIVETVASEGQGVPELWDAIATHRSHLEKGGGLERRRTARLLEETERLATALLAKAVADELFGPESPLSSQIAARQIDPAQGAEQVVATVAAHVLGTSKDPPRSGGSSPNKDL
jgi:LAO/AO transport system kinase